MKLQINFSQKKRNFTFENCKITQLSNQFYIHFRSNTIKN